MFLSIRLYIMKPGDQKYSLNRAFAACMILSHSRESHFFSTEQEHDNNAS